MGTKKIGFKGFNGGYVWEMDWSVGLGSKLT